MIHHRIMENRAPAQKIPETYAGFGSVDGGDNNDYEACVVDVVLLITYTNEVWMHDACVTGHASVKAVWPVEEVAKQGRWQERWRYKHLIIIDNDIITPRHREQLLLDVHGEAP